MVDELRLCITIVIIIIIIIIYRCRLYRMYASRVTINHLFFIIVGVLFIVIGVEFLFRTFSKNKKQKLTDIHCSKTKNDNDICHMSYDNDICRHNSMAIKRGM